MEKIEYTPLGSVPKTGIPSSWYTNGSNEGVIEAVSEYLGGPGKDLLF